MSAAAELIPPVPAPPHDPYSILLDACAGWRLAGTPSGVEISPVDCAIPLFSAAALPPLGCWCLFRWVTRINGARSRSGFCLHRPSLSLSLAALITCLRWHWLA